MSEFGYTCGFINYNNTICVIGNSFDLDEQSTPHSFVGIYRDGDWNFWEESFTIVSTIPGGEDYPGIAVMVGRRGDVLSISSDGEITDELIDGSNGFPSQYSGLSHAAKIGSDFYAVGMRRQVYKRKVDSGTWERIDEEVLVPIESDDIEGFLCIDGFNESEIYCGGYHGQLWKYDGQNWLKLSSPTNVIIESISCLQPDEVYVAGDDGFLMIGQNDQWNVLDQDITSNHIISSVCCRDDFYFATEYDCIARYRDGVFENVTPSAPDGSFVSTGYLHTNGESVLSIGLSDIMLLTNDEWIRIPNPPFSL
jgi:hypothetical protein